MIRADILDEAKRIVTRDRADAYGSAERNFALIAAYWSDHLDHPVRPSDVAAMMALLKLARLKTNPWHRDSWTDLAGYAACGGEISADEEAAFTDSSIASPPTPTTDCPAWLGETRSAPVEPVADDGHADTAESPDGAKYGRYGRPLRVLISDEWKA